MKLGVLFSGGKDSVYSAYLARKEGHELSCLITIKSTNKDSFMFHTPSITKTVKQAEVMHIPIFIYETLGEKEKEIADLKDAIKKAVEDYSIEGIVTGAIKSVYQASRIQKSCNELGLECFNPLWQKDEELYLEELIENNFEVILTGVFAYPFDESWVFRKIDSAFVNEINEFNRKYKIHVAGEGGEFETYVINCPLFSHELKIKNKKIIQEGENSFRGELEIE